MQFKSFMEALKGSQHKLDKNKNGKVDAHDFKLLRKEEDDLEEAKMTDDDMAERERIVKGMKKDLAGFKSRYGDRAKEVMYATATKQAMKEEVELDELNKSTLASYAKKATKDARMTQSLGKEFEASANKSRKPGMKDAAQSLADKYKSKSRSREAGVGKAIDRLAKEEFELDEAMINGREYASHGLMHPDHAAHAVHKVTGQSVDFYAHGTGDKVEGKVTKNDGKSVHIKDTKGKTHQFKVQRGLPKQQNEEKKDDVPFDGPYTKTKPAKNSDGTPQAPMSRARALAKDAMKKQMKEDIDRLFEKDDEEYNYEGDMAITQLKTIIRHAEALQAKMEPDTNLPEWVQSKITLATDYIQTASDYLHSELEEQAPVAPTLDRKYIKGTPEHKAYKATKKPINGMPTNVKEEVELDEVEHKSLSYNDFMSNLLEYETKDGVYRHKGTYGGSYTDPEGADDADDKKPKQQPAEKRGRGRPAGAKSGARKITGTSKLFK
jgi:hypothetical protein